MKQTTPCPVFSTIISYSHDFFLAGPAGAGIVEVFGPLGIDEAPTEVNFNLFGVAIPSPLFGPFDIPVVFNSIYTLSLSAKMTCSGFDLIGCGNVTASLMNLVFTDSTGNQISNAQLIPVPELSSLALLLTGGLFIGWNPY